MTVRAKRNRDARVQRDQLVELYGRLEVEKTAAYLEIQVRRESALRWWRAQRRPACH